MKALFVLLLLVISAIDLKAQKNSHPDSAFIPERFTLFSESTYNAFAPEATQGLFIADPTINVFRLRASGINVYLSETGIVGMPKGSYGIANGQLTFYSTGATSMGTSTGSGAVGTGTSTGTMGTLGPAMGVSGRSPFASWGQYGSRVITKLTATTGTRQ